MAIPEWFAAVTRQGAFKNGAGKASFPRFVNSLAFFGDEPSPRLLAHFERMPVARCLEKLTLAWRVF